MEKVTKEEKIIIKSKIIKATARNKNEITLKVRGMNVGDCFKFHRNEWKIKTLPSVILNISMRREGKKVSVNRYDDYWYVERIK